MFDALDDLLRCGSSGSDANVLRALKPFRAQILRSLHVMHVHAITAARFDELARVVAVRAADDDDDIALLRHFHRGVLPLFCRLTNGIDETDFGIWKTTAQHV